MTYRVIRSEDQYQVVEKGTDLVIKSTKVESVARELCRSLNLGSGFDGYTPMFFLQEFEQKERPPTE